MCAALCVEVAAGQAVVKQVVREINDFPGRAWWLRWYHDFLSPLWLRLELILYICQINKYNCL